MTLENIIPYIGQVQSIEFLGTVVDSPKSKVHKHECLFKLHDNRKVKFTLTADLMKQIQQKYPNLIEGSPQSQHLKQFSYSENPKDKTTQKVKKCIIL